jgi:hypothetical protein
MSDSFLARRCAVANEFHSIRQTLNAFVLGFFPSAPFILCAKHPATADLSKLLDL